MVALYVMPLTTYLTGRFRTTWDLPAEFTRDAKLSATEEQAAGFVASVRSSVAAVTGSLPDWDEAGPIRSAMAMSQPGFAGPVMLARSRSGFRQLHLLEPPLLWLPVPFEALLSLPHPFGYEEPLRVASSVRLQAEFDRLEELLEADPRMEELTDLPEGSSLTGALAEFYREFEATSRLASVAAESVEHRSPVIVEG